MSQGEGRGSNVHMVHACTGLAYGSSKFCCGKYIYIMSNYFCGRYRPDCDHVQTCRSAFCLQE